VSRHTPTFWYALDRPWPRVMTRHASTGREVVIARLNMTDSTHGAARAPSRDEAIANAQLIAAAPYLLRVLKALLNEYTANAAAMRVDAPRRQMWRAALDAVQRAESRP
jgi:hypothetical protein